MYMRENVIIQKKLSGHPKFSRRRGSLIDISSGFFFNLRLLIEMEGVWWLESSHVIEKQSALERREQSALKRRTVDLLDNLLDNLVLAHYYSVIDNYPESAKHLKRSEQLVEQFEAKFPKKQRKLECARVSVTFSNLLTVSRKMRSDTVGKFMVLYMKFKTLNKDETLQESTAGIVVATMVELAHCDINFRLGPSGDLKIDMLASDDSFHEQKF